MRSIFPDSHHDAVTAAARVAGRGEGSVFAMLDGRGAAEIEVPPPPTDELVAPALHPVELARVEAALAMDVRILEMNARLLNRGADVHPVDDDVEDELQDRTAEPDRAGASDDESRAAVVEYERRRHHARQPASGSDASPDGIKVVLAEHVVEVEAGARNDHARSGPVGCRQRGRVAVGVDGGDVRGSRCAYGLGLARLAGLDSRDGAVDVREEALGQPAAVQVAEEPAAPRPRLL